MTAQRRAAPTVVSITGATAAVFTVPSGTLDGDLLIVSCANAVTGAAVTAPTGWTTVETASVTGLAGGVWKRRASVAAPDSGGLQDVPGTTTYSWTIVNGKAQGTISARYDDAGGSVDIDGAAAHAAATATTATSGSYPSITTGTSGAKETAFGFARNGTNNLTDTAWTPPAGWTELVDVTTTQTNNTANVSVTVAEHTTTATGAQSAASTTVNNSSNLLLFRIAVAPVVTAVVGTAGLSGSGTLSAAAASMQVYNGSAWLTRALYVYQATGWQPRIPTVQKT